MIELILELKQKCKLDSEIGESLNLRTKEISFLAAIAEKRATTSKELSEVTDLSPSRASRVISALYDRGYIEMEHNPEDRRLVNLSLTTNGEDCVKNIEKQKQLCEFDLLDGLSDDERRIVKQGLNILLKKM